MLKETPPAAEVISLFARELGAASRAVAPAAPSRPAAITAGEARGSERSSAALHAFVSAIGRIEEAVDLETETLQGGRSADLAAFNARKSHGLLELSRATRALGTEPVHAEAAERLRVLRVKLERNSALLRAHLSAVQEVSAMMADAIRDADSDGTYSAGRRGAML